MTTQALNRPVDVREESAKVLVIEGAKSLDPIRVICMNHGPGAGQIIIQCYDQAWTAYWGAMGGRTVEQFFADCHEDYLAGCLARNTRTEREFDYVTRVAAAVRSAIGRQL